MHEACVVPCRPARTWVFFLEGISRIHTCAFAACVRARVSIHACVQGAARNFAIRPQVHTRARRPLAPLRGCAARRRRGGRIAAEPEVAAEGAASAAAHGEAAPRPRVGEAGDERVPRGGDDFGPGPEWVAGNCD